MAEKDGRFSGTNAKRNTNHLNGNLARRLVIKRGKDALAHRHDGIQRNSFSSRAWELHGKAQTGWTGKLAAENTVVVHKHHRHHAHTHHLVVSNWRESQVGRQIYLRGSRSHRG